MAQPLANGQPEKRNCWRKLTRREGVATVISKKQEKTLKQHSVHHSKKHMSMMRQMMERGASFSKAHKAAQKKVGK